MGLATHARSSKEEQKKKRFGERLRKYIMELMLLRREAALSMFILGTA
jgi:hypothetical protein